MNDPERILVVEDTDVDRRLAERVLRKVWPDVAVLVARDGRHAIEVLEGCGEAMPDIILLDVNMPTMSGHDFLEAWYAGRGTDIPVVMMLTSSNQAIDRERASRFTCVKGYIVKPITRATAESLPDMAA